MFCISVVRDWFDGLAYETGCNLLGLFLAAAKTHVRRKDRRFCGLLGFYLSKI